MAKTEKPKDVDYDSLIDDLIKEIDDEESLFDYRVELHGFRPTNFLIIGLLIAFTYAINFFPDSVASSIQKIALSIAILALLITYFSFISRNFEERVFKAIFAEAVKIFKIDEKEEEKSLLLKALLKTKSINKTSKLGVVKKMHKEMFTKEKLLERLYEIPE